MSFQAMAWAVDQKLPAMQKIVLLMMANRFNESDGECWPSHELLANECGMDKRSVIRQIDKLIEIGLVSVTKTRGANGMNNANRYELKLNVVGQIKTERLNKYGSDRESLRVVTESHPIVTESHLGSDRESLRVVTESHPKQLYETVIEPVRETIKNATVVAEFVLPNWVDKEKWNLWMMTRKGKRMIPDQKQAQVDKLKKWKDLGLDYSTALADAADAGWQGLFEPKQKSQNTPRNGNDSGLNSNIAEYSPKTAKTIAAGLEWLSERNQNA